MEEAGLLLVDDDAFVLRLLAAVFRRRGIPVATAESGEEALRAFERCPPELVLADVMMPGMSGYELCREVRARGHVDIPFIFCTSLSGQADRVSGLRAGADDYITKPVNTEELVLRVSAHLDRIRHIRQLQRHRAEPAATPPPHPPVEQVLNGQIGGLGVADILQVAALLRKGPLRVHFVHEDGGQGTICLDGNRVVHAACGALAGRRAFLEMLLWQHGSFGIEEKACDCAPNLSLSLDEAILEGLAEIDELRALRQSLPAERMRVERRSALLRRGLTTEVADLVARLEVRPEVAAAVEGSALSEVEALRALVLLASEGFLVAEGGPAA